MNTFLGLERGNPFFFLYIIVPFSDTNIRKKNIPLYEMIQKNLNHLGDLYCGIPYICSCKKGRKVSVPYNKVQKKMKKLNHLAQSN